MKINVKKAFLFSLIFSLSGSLCFAQNEKEKTVLSNEEPKNEENIDDKKKPLIPEWEYILNSSSFLHSYSYKDENLEHLVLHEKKNKSERSLVQHSGKKLKRLFYDEHLNLFCVEWWKISSKVAESSLEKITYYFYSEENSKSVMAGKNYQVETKEFLIDKNSFIQSFYNAQNFLVERNEYEIIVNDKNENISYSKNYSDLNFPTRLVYSFFYNYDDNGNIIEENETHYEYRTLQSIKSNKITVRKNIYEYTSDSIPPNTSFYENNILRMKTIYSSEHNYIQNIYFDNNNYIKTQYYKGVKVSEVLYSDGKAYE